MPRNDRVVENSYWLELQICEAAQCRNGWFLFFFFLFFFAWTEKCTLLSPSLLVNILNESRVCCMNLCRLFRHNSVSITPNILFFSPSFESPAGTTWHLSLFCISKMAPAKKKSVGAGELSGTAVWRDILMSHKLVSVIFFFLQIKNNKWLAEWLTDWQPISLGNIHS